MAGLRMTPHLPRDLNGRLRESCMRNLFWFGVLLGGCATLTVGSYPGTITTKHRESGKPSLQLQNMAIPINDGYSRITLTAFSKNETKTVGIGMVSDWPGHLECHDVDWIADGGPVPAGKPIHDADLGLVVF